MKPKLLFIVTTDPRTSPRPAEAIRIAAGVGTWKRAEIAVYLRGAAVLALSEYADELIDEDNFVRYLPIIGEWKKPIYVQKGAAEIKQLGEPSLPYDEIDDGVLAGLCADSTTVLRF
jgi:sulfur relay (sulfurtransferase) DsrF/TusC family protein